MNQENHNWIEENNKRVIFQNHMYKCAGRDNPDHPMHGLFTGLWHDFCLNEAGLAQRNMWFERMEFVRKVESGEIKLEQAPPEIDFHVSNVSDPVDDYLNCSAECTIDDKECEDVCLDDLKEKQTVQFTTPKVFESPHQQAFLNGPN
tara:strand:+ start:76 stop:516 length:441 start_codon:yes stop_codon:yes gene_type:complete